MPAFESDPAQKRRLMPANKRKALAISRLRELADVKISHLEDVTNRAERRFKCKEYSGALAQNSQGANHALHPDYTLPHLIHGDTIYKYKISGPFVGMSVSPGTLIQVNGEDYVEYRVLAKPRF
ncbi:hypothetical protein CEP52_016842 [Fusarium oligoseptatum]|uniref:Uncharacterized protein n=1 Tax=Fusarium oligoseptatum TaxID=2604345 RepID=A0A428RZC5_9HYPO|nr:hypothetical protein CEP52_016842 [Fusarium oligoseptatum]